MTSEPISCSCIKAQENIVSGNLFFFLGTFVLKALHHIHNQYRIKKPHNFLFAIGLDACFETHCTEIENIWT